MVGQEALVEHVLNALLAYGQVLLEGVSGLAKTLVVKTMDPVLFPVESSIRANNRLRHCRCAWWPNSYLPQTRIRK